MQKHNILKKLTTFVITIALTMSLLPTTVYADGIIGNATGTGSSSVSNGYIDGASASKSFLRCYVIEPEHGAAITQAVDVFYGGVPSDYHHNTTEVI